MMLIHSQPRPGSLGPKSHEHAEVRMDEGVDGGRCLVRSRSILPTVDGSVEGLIYNSHKHRQKISKNINIYKILPALIHIDT